jgi:hypothetical protein
MSTLSYDTEQNHLAEKLHQSATFVDAAASPPATAVAAHTPPSVRPNPKSLPTTITRSSTSLTLFGIEADADDGHRQTVRTTHGWVQLFQDRIVIAVTQLPSGHVGSWCLCQAVQSPIQLSQIDYNISTLLGGSTATSGGSSSSTAAGAVNSNMIELYARRIAECVIERQLIPSGSAQLNILLGLSLVPIPKQASSQASDLEVDRKRFHGVVEFCVSLIKDALHTFL